MASMGFRGNCGSRYGRNTLMSSWRRRHEIINKINSLQGSSMAQPHSLDQPSCSSALGGFSDPLFLESEHEWKSFPEKINASERKIMLVDLAMQNELSYQKKMKNLKNQTPNEHLASPLDIWGASSDSKIIGVKREAPSESLPSLQLPLREPFQSSNIQHTIIFCKECQVPCPGKFNLWQHRQGKKHKAKLDELKNGRKMGTGPIICQVCKIPCMNEFNYREHVKGKKHAACVQATSDSKEAKIEWDEEDPMIDWDGLL